MREEPIYQAPEGWIIEYPQFAKLADEQLHTMWPWDEPEVENDVQDVRVRMTEAEQHGLTFGLKLFTKYEMFAGDDYWSNRIMGTFKRPEIQRMASLFSAVELNSHAPFYSRINELLYLDTEEFYSEWKESKVLSERMKFIGDIVNDPDDLLSLAGFSFIEGAVLYSSFAFFKHFQAQECGKDLIKNICRGINQSVADENTHAVGSAALFNTVYNERDLSIDEKEEIKTAVLAVADQVCQHEDLIVDALFEKGPIGGITPEAMKDFVRHRINLCLSYLGYKELYDPELLDNSIASWFYTNINSIQFHDFFSGSGSEYHIKWGERKFGEVWD